MPIKWSALAVRMAMDEVEQQVNLAEQFFAEAKAKAENALKIADLPEYMTSRIQSVVIDIERIDYVKKSIERVRNDIPEGAIEAEQERQKHGSNKSLF